MKLTEEKGEGGGGGGGYFALGNTCRAPFKCFCLFCVF